MLTLWHQSVEERRDTREASRENRERRAKSEERREKREAGRREEGEDRREETGEERGLGTAWPSQKKAEEDEFDLVVCHATLHPTFK